MFSKPPGFRRFGALTLNVLAVAATASFTQAADIFWNGPTASYTNAANWNGGVVPGAADNAINANGLANVVQINAGDPDWTVIDISAGGVASGAGAFEQNGGALNVNGWLLLGTGNDATGAYTLNDGTLNIIGGRLFLGDHPGSTSTFTMNGGVINKSGDTIILGDGGWNGDGDRTAVFTQNGGIINSTSEFQIGNIPLAHGTYNLTGGTNNAGNWLSIGRFGGDGKMNMSGGRINKTGGGSFYLGEGVGTGEFNFSGGVIDISSGEFWVGNGGTSVAVCNMSGTASLTVANWIAIGRNGGAGTLNLTNGVINKIGGGNLAIGAGGGAGFGTLNQYGGAISNNVNQGSNTYLSENGGTGFWYLNGGTAHLGLLQFCQNGGGAGVLYLNGGLLNVREINCGVAGANGAFYFNGGTLQANADNASFFHDLGQTYVDAGGAIIDSQDYNITVAQSLYDLGANGGLTKLGSGTLTLNGYNSYSGPTLVSAGKLLTTANATTMGDYTVANNAGAGIVMVYANAQANLGNLTFSGPTGGSLDFVLGGYGNPLTAPVNVSGNLAVNGTITVNISSDLPQIGQFPLVQYGSRTGAGNFVIGDLPVGVQATIVTNGNAIELNIASVNLPRWDGQAGGNWDIGLTANWVNIGNGLPTTYGQGNFVLFDDNAQGTTTVNLTTTVNPGSLTVNNNNFDYTWVGAGKVSGTIGLTKQGAGTLAILNTGGNDYTGVTVVNGGTLTVTNLANGGSPSAIGAASASPTNLVIGNGALNYNGAAVSVDRGFAPSGTNSTISVQTDLTLRGAIAPANDSRWIKSGPGRLTYAATGSNLITGNLNPGLQVVDGAMVFNGANAQTNRVQNDLWVGSLPDHGAALVLTNTTVSVGGWFAIGRGNGDLGNVSTLTLHNSALQIGAFSAGYNNNLPNLATQSVTLNDSALTNSGVFYLGESSGSSATLTLNGASVVTNRGDVNISGGSGSSGKVVINGTSIFGSNNRIEVGRPGAVGEMIVANSGQIYANAWFSVANVNTAVGYVTLQDNAFLRVGSDLNVSDVGSSTGTLTIIGNAVANGGQVFIGKAATSIATLNLSGNGTIISRGNFRVGQSGNADGVSTGTVNMTNGTVAVSGELWVGEAGVGVWNQTGGAVWSTNWLAIARNGGGYSVGTYNISAGSVAELDPADQFIVAENGTGQLNISGTAQVSAAGTFIVGKGSAGNGTVNLDGGTLTVPQFIGGSGLSAANFNGGLLVAGAAANPNFLSGLTTATVLSGGVKIDSGTNVINADQALTDGGGNGGLTKTGIGTLNLNGANTYAGATAVNAGALGGTGTIAGPVTVASGATLAPGAGLGTLTINNSLTLAAGSSTSVEITMDGGAASDLVTGLTSVSYNGALVVNNIGAAPLVPGTVFKLFNAATASGNFSSVTVLPAGAGTFNPATGELTITAAGALTVNSTTTAGGQLILSGAGGAPGTSYSWLTSTDVTAPVANWSTNVTGVFSATGTFTNSFPINPAEPARFFRLKTP